MIATALGVALFAWSYAVTCTSVYGASRAFLHRARASREGCPPPAGVSRRPPLPNRRLSPAQGGEQAWALRTSELRSEESTSQESTSQASALRTSELRSEESIPQASALRTSELRSEESTSQASALRTSELRSEESATQDASLDRRARVLVVRPCAGLEPEIDRALASIAKVRTSASIACRFAVESESDPAALVAVRHAWELRIAGLDANVVLTHADAPNHKAAQIEAVLAAERAPFDAIVIADSDVDLDSFDLDRLIAPLLADPEAGAIWAPPVEVGAIAASGDRASRALLAGSLHAFTLLGALDGAGLVGKLFAVRADAIHAIGGFGSLSRVLGEDMELARRLLAKKRSVRVAPIVARSLKTGRSWESAVDRYARWLTVIRAQRPHLLASYPLLFVAAPLVLLASVLLLPFAPTVALATIALTIATRLSIAAAARALAGAAFSPLSSIVDAILSDALLAHAFVRAVATRTLTWRGRPLTIDHTGALTRP